MAVVGAVTPGRSFTISAGAASRGAVDQKFAQVQLKYTQVVQRRQQIESAANTTRAAFETAVRGYATSIGNRKLPEVTPSAVTLVPAGGVNFSAGLPSSVTGANPASVSAYSATAGTYAAAPALDLPELQAPDFSGLVAPTTSGVAPVPAITLASMPSLPSKPSADLSVGSINEPVAPTTADFTFVEQYAPEAQDLVLDIAAIDQAINRVRDAVVTKSKPTIDISLVDPALTAVNDAISRAKTSGWVQTNLVEAPFDAQSAKTVAAHAQSINSLWSRRGLTAESSVHTSEYNAVIAGRENVVRSQSMVAARAKWKAEALAAAVRVQNELTNMLLEVELQTYDVQFDALLASGAEELFKLRQSTASLAAAVAVNNLKSSAYSAEIARLEARVNRYRAKVQVLEGKVAANEIRADAFRTQAGAISARVDAFRARVQAEEAKLTSLRAEVSTQDAQLAEARVRLEKYRAEVLGYAAAIESAKAEYAQVATQARSTTAQQRVETAKTNSANSLLELDVSAISRAVATMERQVAQKRAEIATQSATYQGQDASVSAQSTAAQVAAARYAVEAAGQIVGQISDQPSITAAGAAAASFSRFYQFIANSNAQLATSLNSVNTKVAEAYSNLYIALGRAGAGIEAGRNAVERVSTSVDAAMDSTGDAVLAANEDTTMTQQVSQTDRWVEKAGAA